MDGSIIIAVVSFILGALSSFFIGLYSHNKSKRKMSKDLVYEMIMKSNKEDFDSTLRHAGITVEE